MELNDYTNMNKKSCNQYLQNTPVYIWLSQCNFAEEIIRDAFM